MGLNLKATLGLDGTGFSSGLKGAKSKADDFKNGLGNLKSELAQIFSIAAIEEWIRHTASAATEIKHMAEQASLTTDEVQKVTVAAGRVGIEFDAVATALSKLGVARRDAAEKDDAMLATFKKFGVTMDDLQDSQKSALDLFKQMAETASTMELTPRDLTELRDLFGKSGQKMIAVMRELSTLGPIPIISDEDIEKLDHAVKQLEEMKRTATAYSARAIVGGYEWLKKQAAAPSAMLYGLWTGMDPKDIGAILKTWEQESNKKNRDEEIRKAMAGFGAAFYIGKITKSGEDLFEDKRRQEEVNAPRLKMQLPSDSLTRVGGFLGAGRNILQSISQQQLTVMQQIERNTRPDTSNTIGVPP